MNTLNLYQVARILRCHGIKGELKFAPMNSHFDQIDISKKLFLADRFNKITEVHVEKIRTGRAEGIVKLREIADRTEAEKFSGGFLLIDKSDLPKLPQDEFYVDEIIGMEVIDEAGTPRGVVSDVYLQTAYDIYEIRQDGKQSLIPAVEEFVKAIDRKKRILTLHVIEGLLEES